MKHDYDHKYERKRISQDVIRRRPVIKKTDKIKITKVPVDKARMMAQLVHWNSRHRI